MLEGAAFLISNLNVAAAAHLSFRHAEAWAGACRHPWLHWHASSRRCDATISDHRRVPAGCCGVRCTAWHTTAVVQNSRQREEPRSNHDKQQQVEQQEEQQEKQEKEQVEQQKFLHQHEEKGEQEQQEQSGTDGTAAADDSDGDVINSAQICPSSSCASFFVLN